MVALATKGQSVGLPSGFKRLTASMTWAKGTDFDLAAWFVTKNGRTGLAYYGNREQPDAQGFVQWLTAAPFMKLSADAGQGDKQDSVAGNKEELVIASLESYAKVYLIVWDYTCVQGKSADKDGPAVAKGSPARFQGSNLSMRLTDDRGMDHVVQFELAKGMVAPKANVGLVAILDNTGTETRLTNSSHIELWHGLSDTEQFSEFVKHAEEQLTAW